MMAPAVLFVNVWLKLEILAVVATELPPVNPPVLGLFQEKKTPVSCVVGVKANPVALQTVSYLVGLVI